MPTPDVTPAASGTPAPSPRTSRVSPFRPLPTALAFSVRDQTRNRLAGLLLVLFVPVWFWVMSAMAGHDPLTFRLFADGRVLKVDGGELTLISAGLNSVTMIAGFVVFDAVRKALAFDRRLVLAGYRQTTLIGAKALAVALVATGIAVYTALAMLLFWRPDPAGWCAVLAGFTVIALTYGAFGLLLGVLVRNDLEGFFLIIMGGLMDTFLQNPLGNPLANKPVLEWFPSFGPMQFSVAGAFGRTALWPHLALGLVWAAGFAVVGLAIFHVRTRNRTQTRTRRTARPGPDRAWADSHPARAADPG